MLPPARPREVALGVLMLALSVLPSMLSTDLGLDHMEQTLRGMPGAEDIRSLIAQWRPAVWALMALDGIANLLLIPGVLKGKRRARRGVVLVAALEAAFNLPGVPGHIEGEPLLALTLAAGSALQIMAALTLYGGNAGRWFAQTK